MVSCETSLNKSKKHCTGAPQNHQAPVCIHNNLEPFGTHPRHPCNPQHPRNPRNPRKQCHQLLPGPSVARGQDDSSLNKLPQMIVNYIIAPHSWPTALISSPSRGRPQISTHKKQRKMHANQHRSGPTRTPTGKVQLQFRCKPNVYNPAIYFFHDDLAAPRFIEISGSRCQVQGQGLRLHMQL